MGDQIIYQLQIELYSIELQSVSLINIPGKVLISILLIGNHKRRIFKYQCIETMSRLTFMICPIFLHFLNRSDL